MSEDYTILGLPVRKANDLPESVWVFGILEKAFGGNSANTKPNQGKSMPCVPVVTTAGNLLCYSCYQDSGEKLDYWLPDDKDNYPVECDVCGLTMTSVGS